MYRMPVHCLSALPTRQNSPAKNVFALFFSLFKVLEMQRCSDDAESLTAEEKKIR